MKASTALSLVAVCAALLLSGCVTTQTRINQHPEIFQSLSPSDQALVSRGEVRPGMSQNAVWLAWGTPEQKIPGNVHGRLAETWVYMTYTDAYPYGRFGYGYPFGPYFGGGGYVVRTRHGHRYAFIGNPYYDPFFYSPLDTRVQVPAKLVSFQNGRVVAMQYLMPGA